MGEQMSKEAGGDDHGHSHSHGGNGGGHGHSHGGKPCHGHGNQGGQSRPAPKKGGHGHSHGGKPCHGHGEQNHGHSHAAPSGGHGHSHGGKPCHGHGGDSQPPPLIQKRMKVADVFLRVSLVDKLSSVFAKYHTPTAEEAAAAVERQNKKKLDDLKLSEEGGDKEKAKADEDVVSTEDQYMTREEFRKFLYDTRCAAAAAFGLPATRDQEVAMMEAQILARARFNINDPKVDIKIPEIMFLQIVAMLVRQACVSSPETVDSLIKTWGLTVPIPNLFIEPERAQFSNAMAYARDELAKPMLAFIEAQREANKESTEIHVRTGFYGFIRSVVSGLEAANSTEPETKEMLDMFRLTPYEQILPEFKKNPEDDDIDPKLLVNQAIQTVVAPLLLQDSEAMKHVALQWGVEMNLVEEDETDDKETNTKEE